MSLNDKIVEIRFMDIMERLENIELTDENYERLKEVMEGM